MNYALWCRAIGTVLLLVIAIVLGLGSKALWSGRPSDWPDLIASDEVAIASLRWALLLVAAFLACSVASVMNVRWALAVVAAVLAISLMILFWGHYVLFGTYDATRAAINVVVAGVILLLLWKGTVTV